MIFGIFIGATAFSYVFRSLGGDDLIHHVGKSWFRILGYFICNDGNVFFTWILDWVEITLIVLPLFAPILATLDFGAHIAPELVVPWVAI